MAVTRDLIEFDRGDTGEVEARIAALPDGGWANLEPVLPDEDLEKIQLKSSSALVRIFSAKGRPVPFGTVVVQREALSVGLEHGQGRRLVAELRTGGINVPSWWRLQQDHARRGVVYSVPRDEHPGVIVRWMLDAAVLAAVVPLRGRWSAVICVP